MEKLLSIILPVYNVEEYLERCIRSLEKQDIPRDKYEVIVVNDGSPDNSREVVIRLMTEFDNLILIDQVNRGVSMARNAGIQRAVGKYLLFVDPDDYVGENVFSKAVEFMEGKNAQVVYLGYSFLNQQGEVMADTLNTHLKDSVYNGRDSYFLGRGNGLPDPDRSWSILFDRSFLATHDLVFLSDVPYLEDGEFIARVLCLAERCAFYPIPFYKRTTRPGSATNSNLFYKERSIDGFIRAAKNLKQFKSNYPEQTYSYFLNHTIVKFTLLATQACVSIGSLNQWMNTQRKLKESDLWSLDLQGAHSIYYSYGRIYNLSPWFYFFFLVVRATWIKVSSQFRV